MGREVKSPSQPPEVGALLAKGLIGSVRKRGAAVERLPERCYLLMDQAQDVGRLAAYDRLCGFTVRDEVPATWLHVQAFPLQAALLAEDDFPFSLAGLVHVSNVMSLLRPVGVGELLRLRVWAENPRPHAKGAVFDMRSQVHAGDELVWEGTSLYLAGGAKMAGAPVRAAHLAAPEGEVSQRWRLPANLGRRYAAVSGDMNPIHLSAVTARLFGFPRPIIHGMWTHARALAALGGRLPSAYRVQVQFAKPILLPGTVSSISQPTDDGWRFSVVNKEGRPHLVGELTTL